MSDNYKDAYLYRSMYGKTNLAKPKFVGVSNRPMVFELEKALEDGRLAKYSRVGRKRQNRNDR